MNSLNDVTQLLQENLQLMNGKQTEFDNLMNLSKSVDTINSTINRLEEDSAALHNELEKIPAVLSSELEKIPTAFFAHEKISYVEEFHALLEIEDTNRTNLQTALKILHAIAQMIKNSPHIQELEKINASIEGFNAKNTLDALKISVEDVQKNLAELVNVNSELLKNFATTFEQFNIQVDTSDMQKNLTELVNINSEFSKNLATNFEQLNSKIDASDAQKNLAALVKINSEFSKKFAETFEQLNAKIDTSNAQKIDIADAFNELKFSLDALKNSADDAQKNLFELVKINGDFSKNFATTFEQLNTKSDTSDAFNELKISLDALKNSADNAQKNLAELVKINGDLSKGFTTTLDDLRLDMAKLSAKLEAFKDSSNRKSRRDR
ncbi:MAG: hypothetical protein IKZ53_06280 [Selenomonadaceae bacterium]|nr:hypothetical protein [Selenomonadaceae bacterium]